MALGKYSKISETFDENGRLVSTVIPVEEEDAFTIFMMFSQTGDMDLYDLYREKTGKPPLKEEIDRIQKKVNYKVWKILEKAFLEAREKRDKNAD